MAEEREQPGTPAGWTCPCGKRNAPGFQFCPGCGGPAAAGEPIVLDHPEPAGQVVVTVPAGWLPPRGFWEEQQRRLAPFAAWLAPLRRAARWCRAHPGATKAGLLCVALPGGVFVGFQSQPNPWTAAAAVRRSLRDAVPTDVTLRFSKKEQVTRIINMRGEPWLVPGTAFARRPGDILQASEYQGSAHWQGFPGRYSVERQFLFWRPATPEEIEEVTGRPVTTPAAEAAAGDVASSVHEPVAADVPVPEPPATSIGDSEESQKPIATLGTEESPEQFMQRTWPGCRFRTDPGLAGSGGISYVVTRRDGTERLVTFMRRLARSSGYLDEWNVYEERLGD